MDFNRFTVPLLRLSIILLFLWFGSQQLHDPSVWTSYLPGWTGYLPIPGEILVSLNGSFEIMSAVLLTLGCYTRFFAFILGLHLVGIAWTAGGAVGVRDATLALCTFALSIAHPDPLTMDARVTAKVTEPV